MRITHTKTLCVIAVALMLGVATLPAQTAAVKSNSGPKMSGELISADRDAIRALDAKFVKGWLDDDAKAVLSVFEPEAILLPPGSKPVTGIEAIRSYWFPTDGSHTRITSFERKIDEIDGSTQLAFLRGSATLAWDYEKDGQKTSQTSRSIDLLLLRRDAAGRWHVIRQIWSALPN